MSAWSRDRGRMALALLFALSLAFQLRVLDEKFLLGDEGVALMDAWRISGGEVPYRDFFEIIPPVSFLPTAAVFLLFGVGILQARLLVLAYSLLMILLVDRVCARLGVSPWARMVSLALLTPFGVFFWPVPSHHWVADLFLLAALHALLCALEAQERAPRWAAAAGVCTALCGLSLQDQGGYLALTTLLLVLPWWPREGGARLRVASAWTAGLAAGALSVFLWLLPTAGLGALVEQWILFPMTRYRTVSTNVTGVFAGWEGVAGLWSSDSWLARPAFSVGLTLCTALVFLLPPGALGALALLGWRRALRPLAVAVLACGVLAGLGTAAHRWAITNLVWAAPLFLPPILLALDGAARGGKRWVRGLALTALTVGVSAPLLFGAAYYWGVNSSKMSLLQSRAGSLRSSRHQEVRLVQETLDAIERSVPPGAPLFCNGYTPLLNFLSQRPNPTRYEFFFQPDYNTDTQAGEIVASLRARPEAWVLLTRPVQPALSIESFVLAQYTPVWQNERAVLFRPKPAPPPEQPETQGEPSRAPGSHGRDR